MVDDKRRNQRTDLNDTLTLTILNPAEGREMEPFEATITDVSKTGIGFRTEKQLMIGEMFTGQMVIWTKQRIEVILKIVRSSVEVEDYSYGSIFIGMPETDSSVISIYQMFNKR